MYATNVYKINKERICKEVNEFVKNKMKKGLLNGSLINL